MNHSRIVTLLFVAGTAVVFTGCTHESNTVARNREYRGTDQVTVKHDDAAASTSGSRSASSRNSGNQSAAGWGSSSRADAEVVNRVYGVKADGSPNSIAVVPARTSTDVPARTEEGWYDSNRVWHSRVSEAGDKDSNGVWQPAASVVHVDGNPNVTTGYYDSRGVWHSVGAAGVTNIPIGTKDERANAGNVSGWQDSRDQAQDQRTKAAGNQGANAPDTQARDERRGEMRDKAGSPVFAGKPREQLNLLTTKYGAPDETTPSMAVWHDKGGFKCIVIMKDEVDHAWPVAHTDFLMNAVSYKVPVEKVAELARFDGSVMVDITGGVLSAKCDTEAHNMLALNLANDICGGSKSVADARGYFVRAVTDEKAGKLDPYMQRLTFTPATGKTGANPGATPESRDQRDTEDSKTPAPAK